MVSILCVVYAQHLCYTSAHIKARKPNIELYCYAWLTNSSIYGCFEDFLALDMYLLCTYSAKHFFLLINQVYLESSDSSSNVVEKTMILF